MADHFFKFWAFRKETCSMICTTLDEKKKVRFAPPPPRGVLRVCLSVSVRLCRVSISIPSPFGCPHHVGSKSAAAFWGFSRGGFPENACIGGAISERNFREICRRKAPQNTEKNPKQSSAQRFLNLASQKIAIAEKSLRFQIAKY